MNNEESRRKIHYLGQNKTKHKLQRGKLTRSSLEKEKDEEKEMCQRMREWDYGKWDTFRWMQIEMCNVCIF